MDVWITASQLAKESGVPTMIALIEIPQVCSLKFLTCEPGQCSGWRVPVVARRRVSAAAWWSRSR